MKSSIVLRSALVACAFVGLACSAEAAPAAPSSTSTPAKGVVIDQVVTDIDGRPFDLKSLRGNAVLVVNVASECGYTPQYAELQQLATKYKDKGLVVIGFPSNDHGGQEPADGAAIKKFASTEYGVTFPLMQKVHTTGNEMAPLYKTLTGAKGEVKWNFTKFLLDPNGVVVAKFDSAVGPMSPQLTGAIELVLPQRK
jgi:glutathione peroxidase